MNRLQAFVNRGRALLKQRLVHPQTESLEQAAVQGPTTAKTTLAKGVASQGNVVKLTPAFSLQIATQQALVSIAQVHLEV